MFQIYVFSAACVSLAAIVLFHLATVPSSAPDFWIAAASAAAIFMVGAAVHCIGDHILRSWRRGRS